MNYKDIINFTLRGVIAALFYGFLNNSFSSDNLSDNKEIVPREKRNLKGPRRTIGRGKFGTVSEYTLDRMSVAVKIPHSTDYNAIQQNELMILKKAGEHRNLIQIIGSETCEEQIWIVMELMHGSVRNLLDSTPLLSWDIKISLAKQLTDGIAHLHEQSIIHLDLNTDNLLVRIERDNQVTLKIADFGSATEDPTICLCKKICVTLNGRIDHTFTYTAPELYNALNGGNAQPNEKADIFSLGIIFAEIVNQARPRRTGDEVLLGKFEQLNSFSFMTTGLWRSYLTGLTKKCINPTPSERPAATEVLTELRKISSN
jgi:serine/threonine protein kinase